MAIGVILGVITGAIQGFFGGRTDLAFQRFIEIWESMPELYLLIIFSAIFAPSVALLLILLSLFGWMGCRSTCAPSSCATGRWST
jgi:microcin C transport system permease protein